MSSEYMRQILESIEKAQSLNEGYDDRIQQVVDWFTQNYPNGITKKEYTSAIEQAGLETGVSELRGRAQAGLNQTVGNSRKEFIKDVAAELSFKRDTSKADAGRERTRLALEKLADIIQEAVGNSWPDGDPWDAIYPKARRLGIRDMDMLEWLDRAVKKHIGSSFKGFHDYVAQSWDEFQAQAGEIQGTQDRSNPWR